MFCSVIKNLELVIRLPGGFLKKNIIIAIILACATTLLLAAPVFNTPVDLTQPDGTILHCFASGDEYHNWLHDMNQYTIIQDPVNGWYTYAIKNGEDVKASSYIVGKSDPQSIGLTPKINVSSELVRQKRLEFNRMTSEHSRDVKAPHTGTLNNLVIYIRFSDEEEFNETNFAFDYMFNSQAPDANSMHHYFEVASYGQLDIESSYFPVSPDSFIVSYQDPHPRAYYEPYSLANLIGYQGGDNGDERVTREHELLMAASNFVANQVPANLNIDGDNDGNIDNVCFIIKGSPNGWASLLWPHRWVLYSVEAYIQGKRVWDFNLQLQSMTYSSGAGVLSHEMFHSLGSPDLYRYSDTTIEPIGGWDLMANDHNPPQYMAVFMKYKYGEWLTSIPAITASGTYTLNPNQSLDNSIYKISSYNPNEYFVVEYRKQEGLFDSVPGKGLVVYRVNSLYDGNADGPPDGFYIFRPEGTLTSTGIISNAAFSAQVGRTFINDSSNPADFLSNGQPGGLDISNIGVAGETISFDVKISNIQVMNPNGGEVWFYGAPKTIRWSALNSSGNVKIEYSINGGATWTTLVASTSNNGSYLWNQVPNLFSLNCFLRITHLSTGWTDISNNAFAILNNVPVPIPISPENQATNVPTNPILTWQRTMGANTYHVQVATDIQFQQLVADQDGITHTYYATPILNPFTTYYWNVCINSDIGVGDCSVPMSFITGQISIVPAVPIMVSPSNSATGLPSDPVLSWEICYQADSYEVEIARDNYFTQMVVHQDNVPDTFYHVTHLLPNTHYYWRIRSHNVAGYSNFTIIRNFWTGDFTPIDDPNNPVIVKNDLLPNFPNPFNPETTLSFSLKNRQFTCLDIYNVRGQKVTTLVQTTLDSGAYQITWKGTDDFGKKVASGIYFSKLSIGNDTFTRKMLLLK
jgi:M6 family metalloprotease-like protein